MNNKKFALSIGYIIVGIALIILGCLEVIDSEFYAGLGGGLTAVGIAQLIKNIRYRTNDQFRSNYDVEVKDERNKFLAMKTWSWTGYSLVIIAGILTILFAILKMRDYMLTCAYIECGIIFLYWVIYQIVRKKY